MQRAFYDSRGALFFFEAARPERNAGLFTSSKLGGTGDFSAATSHQSLSTATIFREENGRMRSGEILEDVCKQLSVKILNFLCFYENKKYSR